MASVKIVLDAVDNISGVLTGIVTRANLMTGALTAGLNAVAGLAKNAINFFTSSVEEANRVQLDLIGTTGNLMFAMNTGFDEAADFANRLHAEAVRLGAALPGVAEEYGTVIRGISNDVALAFRDINGEINLQEVEDSVVSLGRQWTLMAKQTSTEASKAAGFLMRLIAGDKNPLMGRNVMFNKLPAFKEALDQVMAADQMALDNWGEVSQRQRVEWLEAAANMALPQVAVERMTETVSGVINTWRNAIFEQTTGILGFLRQLNSRDNATVMGVLHQMLLTAGELFQELARVFPFQGDPMVMLHDAIVSIDNLLKSAISALAPLQNATGNMLGGLTAIYESLLPAIGSAFREAWGQMIAKLPNITNSIISLFNQIFVSTDWSQFGFTIGSGIVSLLGLITDAVAAWLINVDYSQVLVSLALLINSSIEFIVGLWAGIGAATLSRLTEGLTLIGDIVSFHITNLINIISNTVTGAIGFFVNIIASIYESAVAIITSIPSRVLGAITNLVDSIVGSISGVFGQISSNIRGALSSIPLPGISTGGVNAVPNAATGLNGLGLLEAAKRESAAAPIGSDLVVANSSETILTNQQASQVQGALNRTTTAPVINITVNGGGNNQELVDLLLSELGRELSQYQLAF